MKTKFNRRKIRLTLAAVLAAGSCLTSQAAEDYSFKTDPTKVLGAETCKECHATMFEAWEKTHHSLSFAAGFAGHPPMHRTDEAKAILDKMGMRSAKRDMCVQCHYTGQEERGRLKTISGTSCESCHGGAADWNKIHSDKENPNALKEAEKLGMIRPHNTYAVAANCFTCHTVPSEDLVNKGGHTAGSAFELVSWSQGEVRHNLQKTEGKVNAEASAEHKRMLYIVGNLLDLEYGLRGLASATTDGTYAQSMITRVKNAKAKLSAIAGAGVAAAGEIAGLAGDDLLKPNNQAALTAAADAISAKSKAFASGNDGSAFAGVDGLIPTASAYKGAVYQP